MVSFRRLFRHSSFTPLGVFLVATTALAGWLGYEAIAAATSHRRTAEAVLRDYASISATELADVTDDNLDDILDDVFDNVTDELRGRRGPRQLPPASAVGSEIGATMRDQDCTRTCRGLRSPLALFRIDPLTRQAEMVPDTFAPALRDAVVDLVLADEPGAGPAQDEPDERLRTTRAGGILPEPVVVGYMRWGGSGELPPASYGFVVSTAALRDLFRLWYEDRQLLPDPLAGDQPNDSLLYVTVRDPEQAIVFASAIEYPSELSASATVDPDLGGFVVQAAIRPDAASRLVIGGLPSSRLPLLAALLLLTMGVGLAALVQHRREHNFQRLREDFVSGVSHELRTPLTQIRMFAELQETNRLGSDEDRQRAVRVIHREARRLSHLVENILQFSKLRRTEQRAPREELDFADALADGLDAMTPMLHDRSMKLDVAAASGLRVVANREALTRIVVNLMDNAVKYGRLGQTVKVDVRSVNGSAQLSVADEGPGVPLPDRHRIWKAYSRLQRDVDAQHPGTGIGLSVIADLVSQHHGRAWVDDAEGGGARFVVELPLASAGTS